MKKTYLNPELLVVKIATHQMLASSPGLQGDEVNPSIIEGRSDDFEDEDY